MTTPAELRAHPTSYGPCTAQRCANQAVGLCPCGMALNAACLARHARFLGAEYQRHEQEDEQER
jgi:hypothetical protein